MNHRATWACVRAVLVVSGLASWFPVGGTSPATESGPTPKSNSAIESNRSIAWRPTSQDDQPAVDPVHQAADSFAQLIRDVLPRQVERRQDWGHTKRIPIGITRSGHGLRIRLRKREKEVPHGVWKHYRLTLIEPEKHLHIRVENPRHLDSGRIALTVHGTAKVHGWARAKVYNRGIHVIGLTAEGNTTCHLTIDCNIGLRLEPALFLFGLVVDPVVTHAQLRFEDFHLSRVGEFHGPLVRELGDGLQDVMEDALAPDKLTQKLNRAIDKKRDRLRFSPDQVISMDAYSITDPNAGQDPDQ